MLNTAIVGLGNVARWHYRAIERTAGVALTAVADLDESVVQNRATEWGTTPYTDVEELLASEQVDWAHVCTPLASHAEVARQCLEAGAHVLVEKPMTATRQEYESLVRRADHQDRRVTVVHNQVNYPPFVRARQLVESGRFGRIHGVSVRWLENNDPREPGRGEWVLDLPGGEFGEGIVHPIYIGLRMAGYPANEEVIDTQRINTTGDESVEYDGIAVSYSTADDVVCTIQHHSNVQGSRQVEYFLEEGRIVADIPTQTVQVYPEGYGGNATVDRPILNAAWWSVRNAASAVQSAASIQFKQLVADLRDEEFTVHDTHTPVIRQEANAIRGTGDDPTPRAEADWTNHIFTRINGDSTS
ncbi:MAG: Gfo/Idh/MocA family protein [Halobellus sp.]|uniref:Gfo/Idh/MocA family protein n=1 Tax=Halobellus sp. TaxID=1979212 RepID=UPI0035D52554